MCKNASPMTSKAVSSDERMKSKLRQSALYFFFCPRSRIHNFHKSYIFCTISSPDIQDKFLSLWLVYTTTGCSLFSIANVFPHFLQLSNEEQNIVPIGCWHSNAKSWNSLNCSFSVIPNDGLRNMTLSDSAANIFTSSLAADSLAALFGCSSRETYVVRQT